MNTAGTAVAADQRYYAWGSARYESGALPTSRYFTGQIKDATGLYYYNARYYDPALGRFIQPDTIVPDPANPQSLNRYAYVLNNPLRYTDPSGHFQYETETGENGELYDLLGFESDETYHKWWNNLPQEWRDHLLDARWGSMLTFSWDSQSVGGRVETEVMFAKNYSIRKLVFWNGQQSIDYQSVEDRWVSLHQNGELLQESFIPWDSDRHSWQGQTIGQDGTKEVVMFDDEFWHEYVRTNRKIIEGAVTGSGLLSLPTTLGKALAATGVALFAADLMGAFNDTADGIPYIHPGNSSDWWAWHQHYYNPSCPSRWSGVMSAGW